MQIHPHGDGYWSYPQISSINYLRIWPHLAMSFDGRAFSGHLPEKTSVSRSITWILMVECRTGIPSVRQIHPHGDGYWSYPQISSINYLRLLPHLAMSFEGRAFSGHLPEKTSVSRSITWIIMVEYRTGIPSVRQIHPHGDGYWSYPQISSINYLRLLPHLAMSFEGRAFSSRLPQKTSVSRSITWIIMVEYRTGIPSVRQIHPHGDGYWSYPHISSINYLRLLPHLAMSFEGRDISNHLPQKTSVSRSIRWIIIIEYRTGIPSVMQIHPHGDGYWSYPQISTINYLRILPHLAMSFEGRDFSSHVPQKTSVSRSIRWIIMVE